MSLTCTEIHRTGKGLYGKYLPKSLLNLAMINALEKLEIKKKKAENLWNEPILRESPTHLLSFAADVLKYKSFLLRDISGTSQDHLPLVHFKASG